MEFRARIAKLQFEGRSLSSIAEEAKINPLLLYRIKQVKTFDKKIHTKLSRVIYNENVENSPDSQPRSKGAKFKISAFQREKLNDLIDSGIHKSQLSAFIGIKYATLNDILKGYTKFVTPSHFNAIEYTLAELYEILCEHSSKFEKKAKIAELYIQRQIILQRHAKLEVKLNGIIEEMSLLKWELEKLPDDLLTQ